MKKFLTFLLIFFIVFTLMNISKITELFGSIIKDTELKETITIDKHTIDFSKEDQEVTYAKLIPVIGQNIFQWDLPIDNSNLWYINYIDLAKEKGLISKNITNYENSITLAEAINTLAKTIELKGEINNPILIDKYIDVISKYFDQPEYDLDSLTKTYINGILPSMLTTLKLNEKATSEDIFPILEKIIDSKKRTFPFIVDNDSSSLISLDNTIVPSGIFYSQDELIVSTEISNTAENENQYWYGLSLKDPLGKWYDVPAKKLVIDNNSSKQVELSWIIPKKLISGKYHLVFSIWNGLPSEKSSSRIAHLEVPNSITIFNHQDDFETYDKSIWKSSTFKLGRTSFLPRNVNVDDGSLIINMPENSFGSGEIQSIDLKSFGSYEIRMKLPDAKGSITGFFMYKAPDYFHEIDIEIYNDKSQEFFLTTYANGKIQNEFLSKLEFDPTEGFNNYRFDYYPDKLDYYINDVFITSFSSGYSLNPMHLILNCWYPNWLEDGPSDQKESLIVKWIRY